MDPCVLSRIEAMSRPHYGGTAHGFDHAQRVAELAERISLAEGGCPMQARIAAYLHDVARENEEKGLVDCHAEAGAQMAADILSETGIEGELAARIVSAIQTHRARKGLSPRGLLGRILQDADRLDAVGAIAVARVFAKAGQRGIPLHDPALTPKPRYDGESRTAIHHFFEKILNLSPEHFHTEAGRQIARARHAFAREFVQRFLDEWDGKA